ADLLIGLLCEGGFRFVHRRFFQICSLCFVIYVSWSALLTALALFLPPLQPLDDGVLHLLGRVGFGEVFLQHLVFDGHAVHFGLLFLAHDVKHGVVAAFFLLAQLFDALGLGEGGCVLGILHGLQKIPLFGSRQIGQLHSGIEGYFLLVHQVQKLGDEVGEADEALDLCLAFSCILCDTFISS